jgi:hypothetical protein
MKRRAALVLCLAISASLALAAPAIGAVTIGGNLSSTPNDNMPGCGSPGMPCTALTFDAPPALAASGGLRSPVTGVVTSWTFKSASSSPTPSISLRVLRPTSGLSFTGAGTSSPKAAATGTNGPFLTNLPINAGDAIGLDSSSAALVLADTTGATMDYWWVPTSLADGQTSMGTSATSREVMVQATVEPTSTTTTNPVQTLKAKKRQKLAKAAVTDTLDKSGTVSLRAKVNLPSGSHSRAQRTVARVVKSKKSTTTLTANVKTKIRIRFSSGARKKIKAAIADSGPRKVTATSRATDTFGNVSTAKVRFKLTG